MSTQLRGRIDAPQNGTLKDWAFDPDDSSARVTADIRVDGKPFRPAEVEILVCDCRTFPELLTEMVHHGLELAGRAR